MVESLLQGAEHNRPTWNPILVPFCIACVTGRRLAWPPCLFLVSMKLPPPDIPAPVPLPAAAVEPPVQSAEVANDRPVNPYAPPATLVEPKADVRPDVFEISESLGGLICEAFAYPIRGGWGTIIIGIVVLLVVTVSAFAPVLGIAVFIGGWAYIGAFYFEIIYSTLNGRDDPPPWPELSSLWDDVVIPGAQMLGIFLISAAPQIVAMIMAGKGGDAASEPWFWIGALTKWVYFPMATLAVVCHGTVWAALPHRVVPAVAFPAIWYVRLRLLPLRSWRACSPHCLA